MKSNFTVTKSFGSSKGSKKKHRKQDSEVDEYVKGEKNNLIEAPIENVTASIVTAAETDLKTTKQKQREKENAAATVNQATKKNEVKQREAEAVAAAKKAEEEGGEKAVEARLNATTEVELRAALSNGLTEECVERAQAVFQSACDASSSSELDKTAFVACIKKLIVDANERASTTGGKNQAIPSDVEIIAAFDAADTDGNGTVSSNEFVMLCTLTSSFSSSSSCGESSCPLNFLAFSLCCERWKRDGWKSRGTWQRFLCELIFGLHNDVDP